MKRAERRITILVGGLLLAACGNGGGGEAPVCGDGIRDPGEGCDDGNRVAGDECNPQCVPTGTLVECVPLLEGHENNEAKALLPLPDGSFLVGGNMKLEQGTVNHGWVGRFDRSGQQLWLETVAPLTEDYGNFIDLASDGQDGSWALIADESWNKLIQLDDAGNIGTVVDIDAAFDLPVIAHAIEFGETNLWIGGERQGDFWLGRYAFASGEGTTVLFEDHIGFRDAIHAVGRSETEIAAAATVSTSPNNYEDVIVEAATDILLIRFDLQGNELGRALSEADPESSYARKALAVATDDEGGWLVGGVQTPIDLFLWGQVWLSRFEPTPTWEWSSAAVFDGDGGAWDSGVLVGNEGVVLVGSVNTGHSKDTYMSRGWVNGFSLDGTRRWGHAHVKEGYSYYVAATLGRDFDAQIRMVGKAWTEEGVSAAGGSLLESCLIAR